MTLIASGVFKKVFLATFLATHAVEDAFVAPENYGSLELLLALYAYTVQVFCDFSGYTDLGRGLALLLGFELPENFDSPYAATNIGEFWRRWHMTLSTWLREYLYFPLGGSRGGHLGDVPELDDHLRAQRALARGLVGVRDLGRDPRRRALRAQALARSPAGARERGEARTRLAFVAMSWFVTFHLCVFARVFFKAADLSTAWLYLQHLFGPVRGEAGVDLTVVAVTLIGLSLNFVGRPLQRAAIAAHAWLPRGLRPIAWSAIAFLLLALRPGDVAPYIYFQF